MTIDDGLGTVVLECSKSVFKFFPPSLCSFINRLRNICIVQTVVYNPYNTYTGRLLQKYLID